ncbi:MAG: hypothetical protein ACTSU2_09670 [Promethearchaeota archaeon]
MINVENHDSKINKFRNLLKKLESIKDEFDKSLDSIKDEEIPTRTQIINLLYFQELKKFKKYLGDLNDSKLKELNRENSSMESSRLLKIQKLIEQYPEDIMERKKVLAQILNMITEISKEDRESLYNTFINYSKDELKKAVNELCKVFEIK